MNSLLLIIDLQKSFINKHTKKVPLKIEKLIKSKKFTCVAFTRFINSENSIWLSKLKFNGCITEEDRRIVIDTQGYKVLNKSVYTALNVGLKKYISENKIDEIYLCGLETDACVYKTAIDLFENNYNVFVLEDYCMCCSGVRDHKNAIKILRKLIGKNNVV